MLHKTRGIVFRVTDYGETSVVAHVYTELFGLQGFIINSVRKKNSRVKQNILHPLSLLDLVIYHKEKKGLHRAADVRAHPILQNISGDIYKTSIALFLDEVLCKSVREEEANQQLFDFLFHSIQILDMQSPVSSSFHLTFLIRLSRYLGFYPMENYSEENCIFNLQDGVFQSTFPAHPFYIDGALSFLFFRLLKTSIDFSSELKMPLEEKRMLIEKLLQYYSLHISGFGEIKSHKILEEIWSNDFGASSSN
jgi:DNA repair protein RecO (recombination protein O)